MDKSNWESKFENKLGLTENDYNEILKRINDEENKEKTRIIPIEVQRTYSKDFQERCRWYCRKLETKSHTIIYSSL